MTVFERRGRAMGTSFHIVTLGSAPDVVDEAVDRLGVLERRWSRFLESSEVSALNRRPEDFHVVSSDTACLVHRSVQAWELTDGAFDPTVLPTMVGLGYDCTFDAIGAAADRSTPHPTPGCDSIDVQPCDADRWLVRLGTGVGFDPGGIGKGLAADIIVSELLDAGLDGAMVNVGGDLVCRGHAPTSDGWVIDVHEPSASPGSIARVALRSGAVATSTTAKRSWSAPEGRRHHVVDPARGRCTDGPVLATVVTGDGWVAEALATQLLVTGDLGLLESTTLGAVVVDDFGSVRSSGVFAEMVS